MYTFIYIFININININTHTRVYACVCACLCMATRVSLIDFLPADPFHRRTVAALESINKILAREESSTNQNNVKSDLVEQWKFVSRVMDRTLFILFTLICIIFNLSILTSSPFRERFDFCPFEDPTICEELDMKEIIKMQATNPSSHSVGGASEDGHGGGHLHQAEQPIHPLDGTDEEVFYGDFTGFGDEFNTGTTQGGGRTNPQDTINGSNDGNGGGSGNGEGIGADGVKNNNGNDVKQGSGSGEGSGDGRRRKYALARTNRYNGRWEEG